MLDTRLAPMGSQHQKVVVVANAGGQTACADIEAEQAQSNNDLPELVGVAKELSSASV